MKKFTLFVMLVLLVANCANAGLIITGIVDTRIWRQGTSGTWSAIKVPTIEVYVDGTYDFDVDGPLDMAIAADGGGWVGKGDTTKGSTCPAVLTDTFFYVYGTASSYNDAWGDLGGIFSNVCTAETSPNTSARSGNDGVRIGTAQVYDNDATVIFQNSFMYRKDGTGVGEGFEWHPEDWILGGNDVLLVDRAETQNYMYAAEIRAAVPLGTYQIPEPTTMILLGLGSMLLLGKKK